MYANVVLKRALMHPTVYLSLRIYFNESTIEELSRKEIASLNVFYSACKVDSHVTKIILVILSDWMWTCLFNLHSMAQIYTFAIWAKTRWSKKKMNSKCIFNIKNIESAKYYVSNSCICYMCASRLCNRVRRRYTDYTQCQQIKKCDMMWMWTFCGFWRVCVSSSASARISWSDMEYKLGEAIDKNLKLTYWLVRFKAAKNIRIGDWLAVAYHSHFNGSCTHGKCTIYQFLIAETALSVYWLHVSSILLLLANTRFMYTLWLSIRTNSKNTIIRFYPSLQWQLIHT